METLTYEALLRDPELLAKLLRDARRERALAMGQLFATAMNSLRRLSERGAVHKAPPHSPGGLSSLDAGALELAVRRAAWKWYRQRLAIFVRRVTASRPVSPAAFVRPHSRFASKG